MHNNVSKQYLYPQSLLRYIKKRWHKSASPRTPRKRLPPDSHILQILDTAFQASLSSQERRSIRLHVAYCDPDDLLENVELKQRNRPIKFRKSRPFSVSEIVQLAPAVDPRQLLIGVRATPTDNDTQILEIWGLIDAGYSWWEFIRGERIESLGGSPPPDCLTVSVMNPGGLRVSREGETIVSLEKGGLILPMSAIFDSGPVGDYLSDMYREFHSDVCKNLGSDKFDPENHDEDYPQRFLSEFIKRILLRIRDRRHGGTPTPHSTR